MSFGREKRLLLGWLAALAPLPLPFNDVLEWSFVLAYWLAVAVFLFRASQGSEEWLPNWALNVIGLIYLPVIYLDVTRFLEVQILRPLLHLAGFALVVKLFALHRERDKWHSLTGIFFLFLAAMGTSVHPAVLLYLVVFLALSIATLMRFAAYHFLADFRQPRSVLEDARLRGVLGLATAVTVVLAALLFPFLPRVGTPFIDAAGPGGGRRVQSSGFSNVMTLDGIGRIRANQEIAMRLQYETPPPMGHELRYKGSTYDLFQGDSWRQSPLQPDRLQRGDFGYFHLRDGEPQSWVSIWQEPIGIRNLFLPGEALALDTRIHGLAIDDGGAIFARRRHEGRVEYRVSMGPSSDSIAPTPGEETLALDQAGISPAMRALAGRIMGEGSAAERAARLETFLVEEYEYTLDLLGRSGSNPIESFLFDEKRGHCEYFASSMVLLLRSQGIPARLVTGFLGGERNALEGYYLVRHSNAHAWVEAFLGDQRWRVFEPTPPSGRPTMGSMSGWSALLQAYDSLVFRWDRYILSFGASDQAGFFVALREAWGGMKDFLFGGFDSTLGEEDLAPAGSGGREDPGKTQDDLGTTKTWFWLPVVLALLIAAWAWVRRPPFNARRAYRQLLRVARQRGLDLPDSVPPVAAGERLKEVWPDAATAVDPIVLRYLEESFGGRPVEAPEVKALREKLRQARTAIGKAA